MIKEDLERQGLGVFNVAQTYSRRCPKKALLLYRVIEENEAIYKIKDRIDLKVTVEKTQITAAVLQVPAVWSYPKQLSYGSQMHSMCVALHTANECPINKKVTKKQGEVKCANCLQKHTVIYRGCKNASVPAKKTQARTNKAPCLPRRQQNQPKRQQDQRGRSGKNYSSLIRKSLRHQHPRRRRRHPIQLRRPPDPPNRKNTGYSKSSENS